MFLPKRILFTVDHQNPFIKSENGYKRVKKIKKLQIWQQSGSNQRSFSQARSIPVIRSAAFPKLNNKNQSRSLLDKKQVMEFRLRQYLPDDKHWRWERCWEITGLSGRFQTLGLVQCKHDGFREALVNFKALYQKHAALFILAIWLYLKHIGPDQVKFTFYFPPLLTSPPPLRPGRSSASTAHPSAARAKRTSQAPSEFIIPCKLSKMRVAQRRTRLSSKSPKKFMRWIQIKVIRVITRFVVRALGARKMRGV